MQFGKIVNVNVAKTWDLVCRHRTYSCPDTPKYNFVRSADVLQLKGIGNQNCSMKVVNVCHLNLTHPQWPENMPDDWRKRLEDYIAEARLLPGILDRPGDYRFYGLTKDADDDYEEEPCTPADNNSWPKWLQAMAQIKDLNVQAALALWRDKESFFRWPRKAELLWQGVTRHHDGYRQDCYQYPEDIKCRIGQNPDRRNNGPAIHAFCLADGIRPKCWHI